MAINDGRVISNFIVQALNNENITIYGEGVQTRSLCYVDDLIDGFIKFMNTPDLHVPINLGNPVEMTIIEIAELIIKLTHSKSILSFMPLPQDDPLQRCPDISKANTLLNWAPKTDQKSGLEKTIDYFKNKLQNEAS